MFDTWFEDIYHSTTIPAMHTHIYVFIYMAFSWKLNIFLFVHVWHYVYIINCIDKNNNKIQVRCYKLKWIVQQKIKYNDKNEKFPPKSASKEKYMDITYRTWCTCVACTFPIWFHKLYIFIICMRVISPSTDKMVFGLTKAMMEMTTQSV